MASKAGWSAVGIELTEDAAASARAATGLDIRYGDISSTSLFDPSSFDTVTLWGVLEHVPQPRLLLRSAVSALVPGGCLLLETPSTLGLFRMVARLTTNLSAGLVGRASMEMIRAGHVTWVGPRAITYMAANLGLTVLDISGSKNSTRNLVARFQDLSVWKRLPLQASTALLNNLAKPLGRSNHLLAALVRPGPESQAALYRI